jgi:hypothetical protein
MLLSPSNPRHVQVWLSLLVISFVLNMLLIYVLIASSSLSVNDTLTQSRAAATQSCLSASSVSNHSDCDKLHLTDVHYDAPSGLDGSSWTIGYGLGTPPYPWQCNYLQLGSKKGTCEEWTAKPLK